MGKERAAFDRANQRVRRRFAGELEVSARDGQQSHTEQVIAYRVLEYYAFGAHVKTQLLQKTVPTGCEVSCGPRQRWHRYRDVHQRQILHYPVVRRKREMRWARQELGRPFR